MQFLKGIKINNIQLVFLNGVKYGIEAFNFLLTPYGRLTCWHEGGWPYDFEARQEAQREVKKHFEVPTPPPKNWIATPKNFISTAVQQSWTPTHAAAAPVQAASCVTDFYQKRGPVWSNYLVTVGHFI